VIFSFFSFLFLYLFSLLILNFFEFFFGREKCFEKGFFIFTVPLIFLTYNKTFKHSNMLIFIDE